jgi:hypothetical protein
LTIGLVGQPISSQAQQNHQSALAIEKKQSKIDQKESN